MKRILISALVMIFISTAAAVAVPGTTFAQTACDKKGTIITLKPWYYGLTEDLGGGKCKIKSPGTTAAEQQKFTTRIILTVVEDLLQIAAYVTVAFIIFGGFKYMTSAGSPDQAAKAMKTMLNAVIGMVVALGSIALVNFVGKYLGL